VDREGKSWGYQFRFGLFQVNEADFRVIADAMRTTVF
jgi:hypothetical protein